MTAHATAVAQPPRPLLAAGPGRDLVLVAAVALPLAAAQPVAASIVSLAVFGLAHTFLELRWVLARFRPLLHGRFLAAVCAPATVIAAARLVGAPRPVEVAAGFALLALAVGHGARTGRLAPAPTAAAAALLAAGLAVSLRSPVLYGIVLAHLHNLVTGLLLWDWAGEAAGRRFRLALVAAFAVVPALILAGAFDALLPGAAGVGQAGAGKLLAGSVTPHSLTGTALGVRVLAAFAFLQLVHYGVWCWLLPRRSPAPPAERRVPWAAVAAFATVVLALVFRADYASGRTLYTSLATYHAYLELPVVLVLLGGARAAR